MTHKGGPVLGKSDIKGCVRPEFAGVRHRANRDQPGTPPFGARKPLTQTESRREFSGIFGNCGRCCLGLWLSLSIERVAAKVKFASFLAENASFSNQTLWWALLTQNDRISQPKTSSPRGIRTKTHWLTLHAAAPQDNGKEVSQNDARCTILSCTSLGTHASRKPLDLRGFMRWAFCLLSA